MADDRVLIGERRGAFVVLILCCFVIFTSIGATETRR